MNTSGENTEQKTLSTGIFVWATNSIALMVSALVFKGVVLDKWYLALLAALLLSLAAYLIEPLLFLFTLPINVATFGFFSIVLNGIVLILVSHFTPGFEFVGRLYGIFPAVLTSIILSIMRLTTRSIHLKLRNRK